jgi:hypothetical protein
MPVERHTSAMGSKGPRRRKPPSHLPPVPDYVPYPKGGRRYWRLGGPLTRDHEAEALAAQAARPPGRVGSWVLRKLGYRPGEGR